MYPTVACPAFNFVYTIAIKMQLHINNWQGAEMSHLKDPRHEHSKSKSLLNEIERY